MRTLGRKTAPLAVVVVALGTALSTALGAAPATAADGTASTVTVDTGSTLATVGAAATGVNDWQLDPNVFAPGTDRLLTAAGARVRELNTGPYDDVYRWRTNSYDPDSITGTAPAPQPWQKWVAAVKPTGAQMMVHVNYGSTATDGPGGTDIGPREAADWVRQANIVDHDGIRYWVIGEEVWGNGYLYQPASEPDHHADRSPAAYGRNVARFAAAMKAVDPSIRIGVEAAAFPGAGPAWNEPMLTAAGGSVDFLDVHPYPYPSGPDSTILGYPAGIPAMLADLREQITATEGTRPVPVVVGETNLSVGDPATQSVTMPSALFAADDVTTLLEQGAANVIWFDSHHSIQPDTAGSPDDPDGSGFGTWALLSDGPRSCGTAAAGDRVCQPALNRPYPAYYGFGMAAALATPGARLVSTSGASSPIVTHAAVRTDGTLVVLVENEDPENAHDVTLNYRDFTAAPLALAHSYGRGDDAPKSSITPSATVHLAPYSMTELTIAQA